MSWSASAPPKPGIRRCTPHGPVRVFDLTLPLAQVSKGYQALAEHCAIKTDSECTAAPAADRPRAARLTVFCSPAGDDGTTSTTTPSTRAN